MTSSLFYLIAVFGIQLINFYLLSINERRNLGVSAFMAPSVAIQVVLVTLSMRNMFKAMSHPNHAMTVAYTIYFISTAYYLWRVYRLWKRE